MTASHWRDALHERPDGIHLDVEVVPNAASPAFPIGYDPWRRRLQARVGAPPEDGNANAELVGLIAQALGVPPRDVTIVEGARARRKRVRIASLGLEETLVRLEAALRAR